MKKILKKIGNFLIEFVLFGTMLISAQHVMNLPLVWIGIGYLVIFCVALTAWNFLHQGMCSICYNEDQTEQTPNESYKNSYFLMKLSDNLILVDKNYVFEYVNYKRNGEKSIWCPFTFEEDGIFSEVRDLIDKEIDKFEKV